MERDEVMVSFVRVHDVALVAPDHPHGGIRQEAFRERLNQGIMSAVINNNRANRLGVGTSPLYAAIVGLNTAIVGIRTSYGCNLLKK